MKVLVPVKRVCDPDNANKVKLGLNGASVTSEGLEWKPNPFDEYAVEAALRLTENAAKSERIGEAVVTSFGPAEVAQTMRQALAMGAEGGILVEPIEQVKLGELGIDTTPATSYAKFELPAARTGNCVFVENVDELITRLRTEAKAL